VGGRPGNVVLAAERTGLPKDSVANVSQVVAVERGVLSERVGRLTGAELAAVLTGIDVVLGRAAPGSAPSVPV
jgi:mRNA interferase MazF